MYEPYEFLDDELVCVYIYIYINICMQECPGLRTSTGYFCWDCKKWGKEIGEEFQETLSRHVHLLRLLAMLRNTSSAATITAGGAGDLVSLTSPLIRYSTNHFYLFIMMMIIIIQPINTLVNCLSKLASNSFLK